MKEYTEADRFVTPEEDDTDVLTELKTIRLLLERLLDRLEHPVYNVNIHGDVKDAIYDELTRVSRR